MAFEKGFSPAPEVMDAGASPEKSMDKPSEGENWTSAIELPADTSGWQDSIELPDDKGDWQDSLELPDDSEERTDKDYKEKVNEKTLYYDDNRNLYRVDNNLMPNAEYEINEYTYATDNQGRITSAEGKLRIKERDGRLPIKDSIEDIGKGDQKEGDDRGHLIGDQFDGSNGLENMIPQDATINRVAYKQFENELAKAIKCGSEVYMKVEPIYESDSRRPSELVVTYSIDGDESIAIFPNNQEE